MIEKQLLKLNDGQAMPAIGFGTWQLEDGSKAQRSVAEALKTGYRLVDTAKIYGNEQSVGEAIRISGIARKDIFITTKLWTSNQGYDNTLRAFDESMQRLGLEYLDLYLIHWPGNYPELRQESWEAMIKLQKDGQIKSIGVSNYAVAHLEELMSYSKNLPAVNQIEFNPFIYHKQKPILDFCQQHRIVVEAYSPLAMGKNINHPVISQIAHELNQVHVSHSEGVPGAGEQRTEVYDQYSEGAAQSATPQSTESTTGAAGSASRQGGAVRSVTNAQVILRWCLQHGTVPLPRSANPDHIKSNFEVFDFKLSEEQIVQINSLSRGKSSLPFYISLLN